MPTWLRSTGAKAEKPISKRNCRPPPQPRTDSWKLSNSAPASRPPAGNYDRRGISRTRPRMCWIACTCRVEPIWKRSLPARRQGGGVFPTPTTRPQAHPGRAIDLLNTAALYGRAKNAVYYARGIAYEQAGRYAEAQQDFQKVLDMKSRSGPDILLVIAQLKLGRLFQKQADAPKARIAYQNFLAAWKDADPDLPLLHEAKAEYARLQ